MTSPRLLLLPTLKVKRETNDQWLITRKFLDGLLEYKKHWPGPVSILMEETPAASDNLDNILMDPRVSPLEWDVADFDHLETHPLFRQASLVLASASFRQNHISALCHRLGLPCVYVTEYSLKTRLQMVRADRLGIPVSLRRILWESLQELRRRRAIATARAVQCNGTPTHQAYRAIQHNALLYFDSRMTSDLLANQHEIGQRAQKCLAGAPLRLLFSGRLIVMKGADHLLDVAEELDRLGTPYEFSILGDGALRADMQLQLHQRELAGRVRMPGIMDFRTELVPFAKQHADLFVCCHRQGDPSCTYLETFSCGVPMVGYANEAFQGILQHARAGWATPMDKPEQMARQIARLDKDRPALIEASHRALAFASRHTFEQTFRARIDHLLETRARHTAAGTECPS